MKDLNLSKNDTFFSSYTFTTIFTFIFSSKKYIKYIFLLKKNCLICWKKFFEKKNKKMNITMIKK